MFEYKMRSKQTLWNRAWPGTGPDFLAKHTAATHWYPSENMGIYMGVRKVWPFKCQNSENGPFIYFLYSKKRGFIPGGAEKGGGDIRAHIRTMSYIGSYPPPPPPRECRKGRSKIVQTVALQCLLKVKQDLC